MKDVKITILEKNDNYVYYIKETERTKSIIFESSNCYKSHCVGTKEDYNHISNKLIIGNEHFEKYKEQLIENFDDLAIKAYEELISKLEMVRTHAI